MDSLDVIKVCIHRWYVMLPVLILALGAGLGLSHKPSPTYTAFGSFAFVYPHSTSIRPDQDPRSGNPLGGTDTTLLGQTLMADLMSAPSQLEYGGHGSGAAPGTASGGTRFSVTLPQNSVLYQVQTWAPTKNEAERIVNAVLGAAPKRTQTIQARAGAPEISRYTTFVTAPTQTLQLPPKSQTKMIVGVTGFGVLVGAALSVLVDRLLVRRAASRGQRERRASGWRHGRSRRAHRIAADAEPVEGSLSSASPSGARRTPGGRVERLRTGAAQRSPESDEVDVEAGEPVGRSAGRIP